MKLKSLPLSFFAGTILAPLFLLVVSVPAWSSNGITVKQHPTACVDSGTSNSQKCSFASNTTVGNFIWVSASAYPGNNSQNPNCKVSDDGNDSFLAAANNGQETGGGGWIYIWGVQVKTAGTGVTISCTPASGSTMSITVDIFELTVGSPATWTFPDKGSGAIGSGGATLSVPSFTPSNSNEVVLAAGTNDNNEAFSAGANFTLGSSVTSGQSLGTQYCVQGSATATTAPITEGGSDNWSEVATSVSASGSGPSIGSLSPTSGPVGASVTIAGSNFGATQGSSTVTFNGTAATPTSWSNTSIAVPVPSGAASGNVVVTVGGSASNGLAFTVTPSISSLSPTSGPIGTSVTITGANFGSTQGSSTITFNGTAATPTSWSNTQIVTPAPSSAITGNVVVIVGGNASNGVNFTVTSPSISSLSSTSGPIGTSVTITGANFGSTQGSSTITFNGTVAAATSWSNASIAATVPSGATSGNVVVTVGGHASNGVNFTVTPAITSLSPASGPVGTSVTIAGTSFGASQGSSTITFNGTPATPTNWTNTQIVAPAPSGATSGTVVVTVGGNSSNGVNFTVTPAISSLSPSVGQVGTSVTITGKSLGSSSSGGTVTFNGRAAAPKSWSSTRIVATVPSGATTGNVLVTASGTASNGVGFTVTAPPPLRTGTFFVNTTDDPDVPLDTSGNPQLAQFCQNTSGTDTSTPCSLREAVVEANGDVQNSATTPDTIMIPAGTFHLKKAGTGFAPLNATTGHLDITSPVTIVGAGNSGSSVTTIQADSTLNDQVFLIDASEEGSVGFPVAIRNLVIQGGTANPGNSAGNSGGVLPSGGAFEWEAGTDGTGQLQLTNVTITANNATDSTNPAADDGGGIALFNTAAVTTPAQVNISGSVITNNNALDAGGGIALKGAVSLTMSNSTVSGNQAVGGGVQQGGGLFFCVCNNAPAGATSSPSQIQNSTISTNVAGSSGTGEGGGIWTNQSLTINQGSLIQGNTGAAAGGGIATSLATATDQVVITSSTITGNITSGNGGGIEVHAGSTANLQLQFNRIVGNRAGAGTGTANQGTGTVSATANWWGCNQGPGTSPCDTAGGSGAVTFTPWITLSNTASPNSVLKTVATTLTASFLQDSNSNALSASNLGSLLGLPVSWTNPINGTLSNQQITIQSNGTATATLTTSGTPTASATAQVDSATPVATVKVQDFTLSINPPSQTVNVGKSASVSYTVTISPINNFSGDVTLSINAQSGINVSCNPTIILGGSGTSICTATTVSSTSPGPYGFSVVATSGSPSQSVSAGLTVADFSLSISPSLITINPGDNAIYTVTCSTSTGFNGPVQLSTNISGGTFSNNPLNCPGSSALTVTSTTPGNPNVVVTGMFGAASRNGSAALAVRGTASATIAISGEGVCTGPPANISCDVGTVTMIAGSDTETLSYGGLTTAATIAQNFATQFNKNSTQVTATASQVSDSLHWQIIFTAKTPGQAGNSITFSTSQKSFVPGQFPAAYTFSPASGSLSGGIN